MKERISYSIFVDDGFPEADEYSNNYVERRYAENDTSPERISHVALAPSWLGRQYHLVRGYLARFTGLSSAVAVRRAASSSSTGR